VAEQQKISCLVLAAGFSRRMGKPKLELPLGDSTLLAQALEPITQAPFAERILVVQRKMSEHPGFRTIEIGNQAEFGMHRSIRAGVEALNPCEAVCIALADQPFLTHQDYQDLLQAWSSAKAEGKNLLYPEHQGHRGNPALISSEYFREILAEPDTDRGCQYLFRRHADQVFIWPTAARGFYQDVDDWETYQKCLN